MWMPLEDCLAIIFCSNWRSDFVQFLANKEIGWNGQLAKILYCAALRCDAMRCDALRCDALRCVLFLTVLCKFLTNEENGWNFRTKSHCAALRIILNSFRQICDQQEN
jgi:hypothetical protein